jgi:hypothetical protein
MFRSASTGIPGRLITGLSRNRRYLGIVCLFWLYVTLSDVLYARSFGMGVATMTTAHLFAPWSVRASQHLLLLPALLACYWASLRMGWRPRWLAIPTQIALGAAFAAAAYPALCVAMCLGGEIGLAHDANPWREQMTDPGTLSLWVASALGFLIAYGFGLALVTGFTLYSRFRDTELRLAALERQWSAARLAALRMQLSPHTLFNLLHTIRGQIDWNPATAQSMVVQLADLLRRLLSAGDRDFSTLAEELQFVRAYLELQQQRFADRLSIGLPAPAEVPLLWVPSLILQPIVENAVVHGLAGHQGRVHIGVSVDGAPETLCLEVTNTVAPSAAGARPAADAPILQGSAGIGLKNVRERLAVQFGGGASLEAGRSPGSWRVRIVMPALHGTLEPHAGAAVGA